RRLVGYVPQEVSVWTDISGYENLLIYSKVYGIPSRERKRSIKGVLESVGLSEAANRLVRLYSGGMIRRLEIACALLISPEILFLDEPTIGLDPMARKAIWEKLVSFRRENGTTIFFNTHYMDEADLYADEIGIIARGKIVKTGSVPDLKRSVGGEAIHLQLAEGLGVSGEELVKSFRGIPAVKEASIEGSTLRVVTSSAEGALPRVMRLLDSLQVAVEKVSMEEPTLDDVFFKYAGSWLDAGARISEIKKVRERVKRG
ncbi:MAG: ATP-binding cassette domain-containing protein, partial [Candidatus Verstraetearchaeota archaeon]|nr:ATP-binding cassette domain-containing protein [Candidatus Verstraetearchaeota archaeon]